MIVSGWMKLSDCNRGSNIMPNVRIYPSVLLYRTDVCFIRLNMDVIIRVNISRGMELKRGVCDTGCRDRMY